MTAVRCVRSVVRCVLATVILHGAGAALAQPSPPPIPAAANAKSSAASAAAPSDDCGQCGRVLSIRRSTVKEPWTPLGTATGFDSDARAATMFQIGPGLSNQGKVMVGAGGGAAYQKTPSAYEKPRWEVTVKLDTGQTRVMTLAYEPYVLEGDRVRISGRSVELVD